MGYSVSTSSQSIVKSIPGQNFIGKAEQSSMKVESSFLADTSFRRYNFSVSYSIDESWNLISIPLHTADGRVQTLFPYASSSAFRFNNGYTPQETLHTGEGYWLKFPSARYFEIYGTPIALDTIDVQARWNIIGSLTFPIAVTNIVSIPPGMVVSQFFKYIPGSGYASTNTIQPGYGYWVKLRQSCKLILSTSLSIKKKNLIKIVAGSELPPTPPNGEISNQQSAIPYRFCLEQNYPNPFNPLTVIRYQLPVDSWVTLKIYNTLGEEVFTLIEGIQDAGFKSVEFNANKLPSGIYFYRLTAGAFAETKKLLFIK
jgi:hypothetical protein